MSTAAASSASSSAGATGGAGFRVSVPASARQTIRDIREIAGDHADEEIYAMLRECGMDPNETAQRLLLQDTFHEVKRKRDRRKEVQGSNIPNNREPVWRPGSQGRGGGRGGRGNYPPRYVSQGATGVKIASTGKENGVNQVIDKNIRSTSVSVVLETEKNSTTTVSSSAAGLANGLRKVEKRISQKECAIQDPPISCTASVEDSRALTNRMEMSSPRDTKTSASRQNVPTPEPISSTAHRSLQGVDASTLDQSLGTSHVTRKPASVAIKHGVWSQRPAREATLNKVVLSGKSGSELSSLGGKSLSETCHIDAHENKPSNCQEFDVNQLPDTSQSVSSSHLSSSIGSRPSSSYSNRSQQQCRSQQAGPNKEWKPKSTDISPAQPSETLRSCDAEDEGVAQSQPALSSTSSEDSSKLQKKLFNLQFPEAQHVIIPDHLQVPESERMGLSFGSLDALFGPDARLVNDSDSENSSSHLSESSQGLVENAEETCSSNQNASPAAQEADYIEPHKPELITDNLSSREPDLSNTSPVPEYDQLKLEEAVAPGCLQLPVAHSAPTYSNFGIAPPMLGSQFLTLEGIEQQSRDTSRLTGFVQPFDHSPYYTQIYRPAADGAFIPASAASKYNGNIAAQPAQTGQSPQEGGNSSLLSSSGPTPPVIQTAGVLQSSLAVNQQPVPVFRQPTGVHLSHFPPNFFPYSQYLSPFYVPPPTFPHFLSNTHYPQQPPAGSLYPPPAVAAGAAPVKYPISHKPPSNSGNPNLLPSAYGSHSSSLAAYSPVTNGFSTASEDLASSQYKESNVYVTGQQHTEGSAVWIPGTGRDISALQPGSFYNVSQGQHMSFAPTQAGHGAFTGMYHPSQTVTGGAVHVLSQAVPGTVEMVAPPTGVYPHQGAHINWNNNY